jgi:hypothetical protein
MSTTHNRKKKLITSRLRAAATAVSVPVMLFAGAGTAQAEGPANGQSRVTYNGPVAQSIISEALSRGYNRQQAVAILATAMQESGLSPTAIGGGGAWHGVFQQDASYRLRDIPQENIRGFFNRLDDKMAKAGASPDIWKNIFWLQQAPGIATAEQAVAGGRQAYMREVKSKAAAAQALYDEVTTGAQDVVASNQSLSRPIQSTTKSFSDLGSSTTATSKQMVAAGTNAQSIAGAFKDTRTVTGAALAQIGARPLYTPGTAVSYGTHSAALPSWAYDLADTFGLQVSTYGTGGSLHRAGYAFDFSGPAEAMERFSKFVMETPPFMGQTLQLIHQSATGQRYGVAGGVNVSAGAYYAGEYGAHRDHVHWATDVAPILGPAIGQTTTEAIDAADGLTRRPSTPGLTAADLRVAIPGSALGVQRPERDSTAPTQPGGVLEAPADGGILDQIRSIPASVTTMINNFHDAVDTTLKAIADGKVVGDILQEPLLGPAIGESTTKAIDAADGLTRRPSAPGLTAPDLRGPVPGSALGVQRPERDSIALTQPGGVLKAPADGGILDQIGSIPASVTTMINNLHDAVDTTLKAIADGKVIGDALQPPPGFADRSADPDARDIHLRAAP